MEFDVVCFGGLNVDRLYMVNKIAKAEEECQILGFQISPGGSAGNTAVGLARLGVRTGFIGKVVDDSDGRLLISDFQKQGVETSGIVVSSVGRSGNVIGFVDPNGERALYLDPGSNDSLNLNEINLNYTAKSRYLHLTSFTSESLFEAQKMLVEKNPKIRITFDPGMIYALKGKKALKPLIRRSFAVMPSQRELQLLTGKSFKKGVEDLLCENVKIVAVKLGKKGCYVANQKESYLIPPYQVRVVDSTGAGDAFCAGFIYGLTNNKSIRECGILGNYIASRAITKPGARNGLPKLSDLFKITEDF